MASTGPWVPSCALGVWTSSSPCHAHQVPSLTSLDEIIEALKELQLNALEACASEHDQILDFDFGRLEHHLTMYLGPHPS
jgi:hypothetical protein